MYPKKLPKYTTGQMEQEASLKIATISDTSIATNMTLELKLTGRSLKQPMARDLSMGLVAP